MTDQGYSTPLSEQGYSTHHVDQTFVINQKLDSLLAEFIEQKKIFTESKTENMDLKKELSRLGTEISLLKDSLQSNTGVCKTKKKIPIGKFVLKLSSLV